MLSAINFYNELMFQTDEVNDELADPMLAPKLESSQLAIPQLPPQSGFRIGRLLAQISSHIDFWHLPLTLPSPQAWGEGIYVSLPNIQDTTA